MIKHPTTRAERRRLADIKDTEHSYKKKVVAALREKEAANELKASVLEET